MAVILLERFGQLVVDVQTISDHRFRVIAATYQRCVIFVTESRASGGIRHIIVYCAANSARRPGSQTTDDDFIVDGKIDHAVNPGTNSIRQPAEPFGLCHRTRKTIENKASIHAVRNKSRLYHIQNQNVGNQFAGVHILIGLVAQLRSPTHLFTQNVTRGEVNQTQAFGKQFRLCALAGAGSAKQNQQSHIDDLPLILPRFIKPS